MKKILVIDDMDVNLKLIKTIINRSYPDFEVILCKSGREGIIMANTKMPDLIVLDLLMPDMDGYQVCQQLKSQEETKAIPIIMVSAAGEDSEVRARGLRFGADSFLSKPFDRVEIKELINVALKHKVREEVLQKGNLDLKLLIEQRTEKFREIEERFLQISDYDIQFFWEVDSKGKIVYISSVAEKILGYTIEEIIGKNFLTFFYEPNEKSQINKLIHNFIRNRLSFRGEEHFMIQRNGAEVWLSVSGFPVFDKKKIIGYRGVNRDITLRKKVEDQLRKSMKEIEAYKGKLKVLNSTLTLAEESERRRIAEILHDNLGPTLSLANLKITSAINKKSLDDIHRLLNESTILIQDAITQSRSLTYDLIPPVLYELGLLSAIKWKLDQLSEAYEIKTSINSTDINLPISDPSRILLYRIISELLLNIIKHAHATVIEVEAILTTGQICISLIDNGTTPNTYIEQGHVQKQEGVGMFLIRERLDSIMGTMLIEKGHDSENIVKIFVPIGK